MITKRTKIHIGTSGWSYSHWKGPFYPPDLPDERLLDYYAARLNTVEINNTFYRLPSEATVYKWHRQVPEEFIFAAKASRYITHMKKLREPETSLPAFLDRMQPIGNKLGPILFQLPPRWNVNVERFERFLSALRRDFQYTFEFRDPSWFIPEIYALLSDHNAAFCIYDLAGQQSPTTVTADFVYVRLHGPTGSYSGSYPARTLSRWAEKFAGWSQEGLPVFCYFDNDEAGYAVHDAKRLNRQLARSASQL